MFSFFYFIISKKLEYCFSRLNEIGNTNDVFLLYNRQIVYFQFHHYLRIRAGFFSLQYYFMASRFLFQIKSNNIKKKNLGIYFKTRFTKRNPAIRCGLGPFQELNINDKSK